jgi:hypothetical protein
MRAEVAASWSAKFRRPAIMMSSSAFPTIRSAAMPPTSNSRPEFPTIRSAGTVIGTPGYMSPEQPRGEVEGIDQLSDR